MILIKIFFNLIKLKIHFNYFKLHFIEYQIVFFC